MTERVSIIITSLNENEYLLQTVASIYASTQSDFEIIIVDDASNDGTNEKPFLHYPEIRYHRNPERIGLIRSRILGAHLAQGDYLVFLDAHCKPEPGWDLELIATSRAFEHRVIAVPVVPFLDVSNWVNNLDQTGYAMTFNKRLDMKWCKESTSESIAYRESAIFAGCACLIQKDYYAELQGFDEGLSLWGCENIDLSLRCWMLGGKVIVAMKAIVGHMFKSTFNYSLSKEIIISNKLRVAAINFSTERFDRTVQAFSLVKELPSGLLPCPKMVEERRNYLLQNRRFDDDWYVNKFNIDI